LQFVVQLEVIEVHAVSDVERERRDDDDDDDDLEAQERQDGFREQRLNSAHPHPSPTSRACT